MAGVGRGDDDIGRQRVQHQDLRGKDYIAV
jgi:hypothetical protein